MMIMHVSWHVTPFGPVGTYRRRGGVSWR